VCAAGLATSMAQVYSVNAVGYVNLVIQPGFSILANPLNGATNTLPALFPSVPNNFTVYKFQNGAYSVNRFKTTTGTWTDGTQTLVPGEGAFVNNPNSTAITNTFLGDVNSGTLTVPISTGFSMISSPVPQAGKLQTDLGLVPAATGSQSLTVYQFANTGTGTPGYVITQYRFGAWPAAGEPTIGVGEGFFVNSSVAQNWTRTFSFTN